MKALQMLDHVMLWVARVFAAFMFFKIGYGTLCAWYVAYIERLGSGLPPEALGGFFPLAVNLTQIALFFLLMSVCLWFQTIAIARLFLLVAGIAFFLTALNVLRSETDIVLGSIGFGAILWTTMRPPKNSKNSQPNPINAHPLPQSC